MQILARDKIKLVLLLTVLFLPVPLAWSMWVWKVGLPEDNVAHGDVLPLISNIRDWPLLTPIYTHPAGHWYLIFRCQPDVPDCQLRDEMWRLHRALGRDAGRVQRWFLLAENREDPVAGQFRGEQVALLPASVNGSQLGDYMIWLADPQGQVVVSYGGQVDISDVFDDLRHLLKRNPALPQWQAQITSRAEDSHD
ncbi:hypothetical protein [Bacterioplanoides pacificum]|uniref:Uncharacterized protein n=1 Tax=Bacterioplanoides pacificum TaxID=1171596 RepID=A0ABV7VQU1_9GAMM